MTTIYKILFEVRLLHEFYLTKSDGTSIFGAANAAARDAFLQDFFDRTQRSINSDIDYRIPASAATLYKNYRLKLVPTYSGFKIATEVLRTSDGGKIAFKPVAPLPTGLNVPILLVRTNADFDSYTNRRFKPAFNAIYYISNDNTTGPKIFPFLTNTVPTQIAGTAYEQGELSQSGGIVNAFYVDSSGNPHFAPVIGKSFLTEADRILVYPSFQYYFTPADNVKNASFTLKDKDNNTIFTNTVKSDSPLQNVQLRFDESKLKTLPSSVTETAALYILSVTGDGGYNKNYKLFFLQATAETEEAWGMINIYSQPGDPAFNCIDSKGLLLTRLNTDNSVAIAPPVFEVFIKSRYAFWRYINDQGKLLKDSHGGTLKLTGNNLVSAIPQPQTYAPIPVQGTKLPNPKLFYPVKPEGQQIFADIIVPESDIFPLGP
ncbi:MAG: hypothetical protein JST68_22555 [Bacteroidetes bacterium]|nr:hypothetical protein [Bacteroidota bacterium]